MESEEESHAKLLCALEKVGIKCESITFTDEFTLLEDCLGGCRICKVICRYNKPYQVYCDEFFFDIPTFNRNGEPRTQCLEFSLETAL